MTKVLNGDNPVDELSPIITTLRHDLDQKIRRLTDALGTLGVAATELEKVRIALEGTAPATFVSTIAHNTCIQIPAQAVIVAKKHEIIRALETAANAGRRKPLLGISRAVERSAFSVARSRPSSPSPSTGGPADPRSRCGASPMRQSKRSGS